MLINDGLPNDKVQSIFNVGCAIIEVVFRDEISGLEFIRNSAEIHDIGLYQDLGAFKYSVYLNIYEIKDDNEKHYSKLAKYLQGGGVENIQHSLKRIELLPLLESFNTYYDWNVLSQLLQMNTLQDFTEFSLELVSRVEDFLLILKKWINSETEITDISKLILNDLSFYYKHQADFKLIDDKKLYLISWILLRHLGKIKADEDYELISAEWLNTLFFGDEIKQNSQIEINIELLKIGIRFQNLWNLENSFDLELKSLLESSEVKKFIKINEYDDKLWFNQEAFEELIDILEIVNLISPSDNDSKKKDFQKFVKKIREAKENSNYQVEKLIINILEV